MRDGADPEANGRYRPASDARQLFDLRGAVGHLLRRSQQRAVDLFVEEVGEDGPTPRQFAVLLSVHQNPGVSQTDLVRMTGIDRSTLTEILRRLGRRGLIRRERQAEDRRTNALHLTAEGSNGDGIEPSTRWNARRSGYSNRFPAAETRVPRCACSKRLAGLDG